LRQFFSTKAQLEVLPILGQLHILLVSFKAKSNQRAPALDAYYSQRTWSTSFRAFQKSFRRSMMRSSPRISFVQRTIWP
jgi:hypothetical protein